ncbi:MAG: hypothetical protein KGM44_13000 [bacterium]|nr:hypothetical protein [bacterium]
MAARSGGGRIRSFFGRWNDDVRRLALAFAISLALHGFGAAVFHPPRSAAPAAKEVVTVVRVVTIERRPIPTPRPPKPTPLAVHPRRIATIAPAHVAVATPGSAAPRRRVTRKAQAPPRVHTQHHSRLNPVAIVMGGQGAGAALAGPPVGGAGPGGEGTGQGTSGTGSGAAAADEPCGYVEFVDINGISEYDKSTGGFFVRIRMIVHFPDHHSDDVNLDYPWYYPNEAANPWSAQNVKNLGAGVTFQWPPAPKAAKEPPLVRYVMQYTTPSGYTKLKGCPGDATAAPAAATPAAQ